MLGDLPTARIKEIIRLCDQFNDAIENKINNDNDLRKAVKKSLSTEERNLIATQEADVACIRKDYNSNAREYDNDLLMRIVTNTANNMGIAARVLSAQEIKSFIPSALKDEEVAELFENVVERDRDDPDGQRVMDLLLYFPQYS